MLSSLAALYQTRDRGLRPGPELVRETKNRSGNSNAKKKIRTLMHDNVWITDHENFRSNLEPLSCLKDRAVF